MLLLHKAFATSIVQWLIFIQSIARWSFALPTTPGMYSLFPSCPLPIYMMKQPIHRPDRKLLCRFEFVSNCCLINYPLYSSLCQFSLTMHILIGKDRSYPCQDEHWHRTSFDSSLHTSSLWEFGDPFSRSRKFWLNRRLSLAGAAAAWWWGDGGKVVFGGCICIQNT